MIFEPRQVNEVWETKLKVKMEFKIEKLFSSFFFLDFYNGQQTQAEFAFFWPNEP